MAEVLYYAIPFFVLLLIAEYASFRHLEDHDHDGDDAPIGYEGRDTRTSLAMGMGNVVINVGWKLVVVAVYAALYELTPLRLDPAQPADLGRALPRRRPRLLLVPPRVAREPRVLGQPRRAPLLAALQPLDRAAPDVGADDLLPLLAPAAAARLPGLDGPPRPGLVADLPVLDPHGAHQAPAALGRADAQHAVAPPRPPRLEPPVPRQELRRDPHRLGPHLRDLGARGGARPLRPDEAAHDVQPRPRRVPRVHRARERRPPRARRGGRRRRSRSAGPAGRPPAQPVEEPPRA